MASAIEEDFTQATRPACVAELVDEVGARHEPGVGSVLDRLVRDRHGQVGLADAAGALEDQVAALRHESGPKYDPRSSLRKPDWYAKSYSSIVRGPFNGLGRSTADSKSRR